MIKAGIKPDNNMLA